MASSAAWRWVMLLLLLGHVDALARAKPPSRKGSKGAKAAGGGFGGGFGGGRGGADVLDLPASMGPALAAALTAKITALRSSPEEPQTWLEVGAVLVKAREYAEAERIFRLGVAACPTHEMLNAAALTLGGDSGAYWHGDPVGFEGLGGAAEAAAPPPTALGDDAFEAYAAHPAVLGTWDQADRAIDWSSGVDWSSRGSVFRSKASLLPPDECAEAIRLVEAHAERAGGWKTGGATAPTADAATLGCKRALSDLLTVSPAEPL